ncbi:phosphoribosylformylglycinamidine synthase subunit PurS [Gulosibacter hominis]|uniref:phosphoribosylformylglycinamidine synthase subunit PurS n=1 Tax=Gulosibacter hominis TaxID=2770504 RepID=UPI00191B8B65
MPKIIVQVMPKRELLDPAGKAVQRSLAAGGQGHFTDVRIGKRFEITTDREVTADLMEEVAALADNLLSNGVIEDVTSIDVVEDAGEVDPADTETVTDDGFLPTGAASDGQALANEAGN